MTLWDYLLSILCFAIIVVNQLMINIYSISNFFLSKLQRSKTLARYEVDEFLFGLEEIKRNPLILFFVTKKPIDS